MLRFIPENAFLPLILLEVLFALPLAVVMTSCTEELGSVGISVALAFNSSVPAILELVVLLAEEFA